MWVSGVSCTTSYTREVRIRRRYCRLVRQHDYGGAKQIVHLESHSVEEKHQGAVRDIVISTHLELMVLAVRDSQSTLSKQDRAD